VPTRILHVSDLHCGAGEAHLGSAVQEALVELAGRLEPELVIASGDLAHRGRRGQLEEADELLRGLGAPVLAVPGNHDIPYSFPARFIRPWREFERFWGTTTPVRSTPNLQVVGLNSVRPWRHQSGGLRNPQIDEAATRLQAGAPGALRVAVLHHQLAAPPWRTRKRPVARRTHVLGRLVDAGAELIVGGHVHQGSVAERHEFEVVGNGTRGAVVATTPGLGQPRPRRRGEARGVLVYEAAERTLRVETYIWRGESWGLTAVRTFARGPDPLAVGPSV
jgi:3',5'-cyclic AMP phosphodiesterase CpdA